MQVKMFVLSAVDSALALAQRFKQADTCGNRDIQAVYATGHRDFDQKITVFPG